MTAAAEWLADVLPDFAVARVETVTIELEEDEVRTCAACELELPVTTTPGAEHGMPATYRTEGCELWTSEDPGDPDEKPTKCDEDVFCPDCGADLRALIPRQLAKTGADEKAGVAA